MSSHRGSESLWKTRVSHDLVGHMPGHNVHRNREVPAVDRAVPDVVVAPAMAHETAAGLVQFAADSFAEAFQAAAPSRTRVRACAISSIGTSRAPCAS